MKKFNTLAKLKQKAYPVYNWTGIVQPNGEVNDIDVISILEKYKGRYSVVNGIVAFCHGGLYVIPQTKSVDTCLANFLKEGHFPVPFSNGDEPFTNLEKWYSLLEWARRERDGEFSEMCLRYNSGNKISELSHELMQNSIEIPETGLWVLHKDNKKSCYYPYVHKNNSDSYYYLGKFNEEGRVILFIKDGKTYITKYSKRALNSLYHAGYETCNLVVPLAKDGDELTDPLLKAKWKALRPLQ